MEEKVLKKLTELTEGMYTSITKQICHGYSAIWNPRIKELRESVDRLLVYYEKSTRGQILQEQYEKFLVCSQDCSLLEEEVLVRGELDRLEEIGQRISNCFQNVYENLKSAVLRYETIENNIDNIILLEEDLEKVSEPLVSDYKLKIRNRIQKNIVKVRQFDQFSNEEKADFITHTILFDEGKLEKQILEYLSEKEEKVEKAFVNLEYTAVISKIGMKEEGCREYVEKYRIKEKKKNPKEFSTSRQLMDESELGDKFETWFNSLVGKESSVGKLIKEESRAFDLPMEERMYEAIEGVIDSNLGALNMKDMIAAYEEECMALKEQSFREFFGLYEEVRELKEIVAEANRIFPEWNDREVCLGDIILGDY